MSRQTLFCRRNEQAQGPGAPSQVAPEGPVQGPRLSGEEGQVSLTPAEP